MSKNHSLSCLSGRQGPSRNDDLGQSCPSLFRLSREVEEGIPLPLSKSQDAFHISFLSVVAQMVKNLPAMWETRGRSLGQEDPLEKGMSTHPSVLAGEFYGQRSLAGYSPQGRTESDTTEQLSLTPVSEIICNQLPLSPYCFNGHVT